MELFAKIPLEEIEKIVILENKNREYIEQIKKKTKADYVINGGIYDLRKFKPFCNVKANGVVLSNPRYGEYGYSWNKGPDIVYRKLPSPDRNYIGCTGLVLNYGRQVIRCNADMKGRRQRSAIGMSDDNLFLYACNKGDSKTPESLQTYMIKNNWENGLMLDGGGSTQAIFPMGTIRSSENHGKGRIVQNYILVYLRGGDAEDSNSTPPYACPYEEPVSNIWTGSQGEGVKWVQWHLNKAMNTKLAVDGIFGNRSAGVLIKFQKMMNLAPDGICGKNTRAYLKREMGEIDER